MPKIKLEGLNIDESYQRPLQMPWIKKRMGSFCHISASSITINKRPDGSLWVMDGQQRRALAMANGIKRLDYTMSHLKTVAEEALVYNRLNDRTNLSSWNRFNALICGRDPQTVAMDKLVKSTGFVLAPTNTNNPLAVTSLASTSVMFRRDKDLLFDTLVFIKEVWLGVPGSLAYLFIQGIFSFLAHTKGQDNFSRKRALRELAKTNPLTIASQAPAITGGTSTSDTVRGIVVGLCRAYNKPFKRKDSPGKLKMPEES